MATVDWYFDFISPFAYLQSEQLALLGPKTRVRYRPVLFAGLLAAHEHKGPAEIPRKRAFTYRFASWQAKRLGIPFKMPHEHPFNPLPLLRLAHRLRLRARRRAPRSSASCGATAACPTCRSNGRSSCTICACPTRTARIADPGGQGRASPQHRRGDRARRVRRADARWSATSCSGATTQRRCAADYLAQGGRWTDPEYERVAALPVGAERKSAQPRKKR